MRAGRAAPFPGCRKLAALLPMIVAMTAAGLAQAPTPEDAQPLVLRPVPSALTPEGHAGPSVAIDGLFFETAACRVPLPARMTRPVEAGASASRRSSGAIWSERRSRRATPSPASRRGGATASSWTSQTGRPRVTAAADVHQIPLFVREGSGLDLGDLNREWEDAVAAAKVRPDLKALDAALAAAWGGPAVEPGAAAKGR